MGPDRIAFLQYTSDSTPAARGVAVRQGNVMANQRHISSLRDDGPQQGLSWLPHARDGLVEGVLHLLSTGFPGALMSPVTFLRHPARRLQAITDRRVTPSPNFALDPCSRRIPPEDRSAFDLSSLRCLTLDAEPIRPETLDRFVEAFAPAGLRPSAPHPCYGLAGATLVASGGRPGAPVRIVGGRVSARCDRPGDNTPAPTGNHRPGALD